MIEGQAPVAGLGRLRVAAFAEACPPQQPVLVSAQLRQLKATWYTPRLRIGEARALQTRRESVSARRHLVGRIQGLGNTLLALALSLGQAASFYVPPPGHRIELMPSPFFEGADARPDLAQLLQDFLLSKEQVEIID